ncbi:MAG TPA: hypothetical protein PKC49_02875 [Phycisphaerae bacterium]|nr:hypothetical protein [Phycisphaerae bacterium]
MSSARPSARPETAPETAEAQAWAARLAQRVFVRPVFLVASDAQPPSEETVNALLRHLEWAQRRYRELLFDRDTFELSPGGPLVLHGQRTAVEYANAADGGAEAAALELFAHDGVDRFSCPYIYVVLFVGTGGHPKGGGRPLNGGVNTGGGIVILAADNLVLDAGFQSTLQHEIGHGLGLVHADENGLDMRTSDSLMSYNPAHHTNGFEPSPTPGMLAPEDLRLLALNRRALPDFHLDPQRDFPPGYALSPRIVVLPPMPIPGQPDYDGPWNGR